MNGNKLILAFGFAGIVGSMHATPNGTFNPTLGGSLYEENGKFNPMLKVAIITNNDGNYVDNPLNTFANAVLPSKEEVLNEFAQATFAKKTLAKVSIPLYGPVELTTHHALHAAITAALTAIKVNATKSKSSSAFLMQTLSRTGLELVKDFGVAELRACLLDARLKHLAHHIPGVNALKEHPYFDTLVARPANRAVDFAVRYIAAQLAEQLFKGKGVKGISQGSQGGGKGKGPEKSGDLLPGKEIENGYG
jgi:hypothetical protein